VGGTRARVRRMRRAELSRLPRVADDVADALGPGVHDDCRAMLAVAVSGGSCFASMRPIARGAGGVPDVGGRQPDAYPHVAALVRPGDRRDGRYSRAYYAASGLRGSPSGVGELVSGKPVPDPRHSRRTWDWSHVEVPRPDAASHDRLRGGRSRVGARWRRTPSRPSSERPARRLRSLATCHPISTRGADRCERDAAKVTSASQDVPEPVLRRAIALPHRDRPRRRDHRPAHRSSCSRRSSRGAAIGRRGLRGVDRGGGLLWQAR